MNGRIMSIEPLAVGARIFSLAHSFNKDGGRGLRFAQEIPEMFEIIKVLKRGGTKAVYISTQSCMLKIGRSMFQKQFLYFLSRLG
jgi:hypothetical protein